MSEELTPNEENNEELPEKGKIVLESGLGYTLTVDREDLMKAAVALKEAGFDLFMFVSGADYPDSIKLTYRLYSTKRKNKVTIFIKTEVPKSNPIIDSLVPLWSAANWHERETYDLFGVEFKGHPDLRRIFMPENWVGYPLRKDYSDDHMIVMTDPKKEKADVPKKEKVDTPKKAAVETKSEEKPEVVKIEVSEVPEMSKQQEQGREEIPEDASPGTPAPEKTETPEGEEAGNSGVNN